MIRRLTWIVAALVVAAPVPSRAGIERAGTTAANFLQVGTGAGTLGMGGATLGLVGGELGAMTWNAASLAGIGQTQIAFSHVGLAGESAQEWAAVAGALRSTPVRWAFSGLYQGDGSFDGRDALGNPTGSFGASSMALGLNGAYTYRQAIAVGLGLKVVSETLGDVHGSGVAFDLGVHATRGRLGFGAALQNTGGEMHYGDASYKFAANMGVGVSMTDPGTGLRAALDFNIPNAYYRDVRAGLEWRHEDRFALRTGYRHELGAGSDEPMSGPAFGMGAGAGGFWLDYALLLGNVAGDAEHRVALTFRPGAMGLGGAPGGAGGPALAAAAKPEPKREVAAADAAKKTGKTKAAPAEEPVALDTAPARKLARTPGNLSQAAARARGAQPPAPAKPSDAPKTIPVVAIPPAAQPGPVTFKSVGGSKTAAPDSTKPAEEATKPAEPPAPAGKAPEPAGEEATQKAKSATTPDSTVVESPKTPAPEPTTGPDSVATTKPAEKPKRAEARRPEPAKVETAAPEVPRPTHVVVKKGQTLEDIAKQWGCTAAAIMMENNLTTQKPPKPGTRLKLPRKR